MALTPCECLPRALRVPVKVAFERLPVPGLELIEALAGKISLTLSVLADIKPLAGTNSLGQYTGGKPPVY